MSSPTFELKDRILRAGAGAGKTTTLVSELISFYQNFKKSHGGREPKVVVTTFTRKATHELKERLLLEAHSKKDHGLFSFLSKPSKLHVSTIHGVLALFLKKYSSEIGLSPDFSFMSELEDLKLRKKILKRLLIEFDQGDDFFENYQQKDILYFLQQFAEKSVIHDHLTFYTENEFRQMAVEELKSRTEALLLSIQNILDQTTLSNWQEYFSTLLRLKTLNWENYPIAEIQLVIDSLGRRPAFKKAQPPFSEDLLDSFVESLDWFKKNSDNDFFQPQFWARISNANRILDSLGRLFTEKYWEEKTARSQMLMTDLETMSWSILKKNPQAGIEFSKDWDFWMVDEYQDTSPLQVKLLKHLIGDRPQFIVGDPQQSIYLFRGAQSAVFNQKKIEIKNKDGEVRDQFSNYRSRKELLYFFNDFFSGLDEPFEKMEPKKEFESGHSPATFIFSEEEQSFTDAVKRIIQLLNLNVKPEDICVLSRNHAGLEKISKLLKEKRIPYEIVGSSEFKNRREVLDAIHFIRFLMNPHDNKNYFSLLRTPWFHVPDDFLISVANSKSKSFWRQSQTASQGMSTAMVMERLLGYLDQFHKVGLSTTLGFFYRDSGLIDSCYYLDPSGRRESNLWKLFYRINSAEQDGKTALLKLIQSLVEEEDVDQADQDVVPLLEPARVHLMTVHASKGLQFSHVILLGLGQDQQRAKNNPWCCDENGRYSLSFRNPEDQSWIHPMSTVKETEKKVSLEKKESLRVLYVALTRAKESVTLMMDQKPGRSSWQSQLHWDLSEGQRLMPNYSYEVVAKMDDQILNPIGSVGTDLNLNSSWVKSYHHMPAATIQSLSASQILDKDIQVLKKDSQSQDWLKVLKKVQKGTDYHKVFESLKYISEAQLSEFRKNFSDQKSLDYVLKLENPPLLQLIQEGFVEWGFELLQNDGAIFRGQIDLWGIIDSTVWIVDYKTGSQNYKEKAFEQMKMYARCLQQIKKIQPVHQVKLAAVYPLDQQTFVEIWKPS